MVPLLEGPEDSTVAATPAEGNSDLQTVEIGHYCLPEESEIQFTRLSNWIQQGFKTLLEENSHSADSATPVGMIGYETPVAFQPGHVNTPDFGASGFTLSLLTILASSVMAAVIAVVVTKMNGRTHTVGCTFICMCMCTRW